MESNYIQSWGQGGARTVEPGLAIARSSCGPGSAGFTGYPASLLNGLVQSSQWPVSPFERINGDARFPLPNLPLWSNLYPNRGDGPGSADRQLRVLGLRRDHGIVEHRLGAHL